MAAWYALADSVLRRIDAEAAHSLAIRALKTGLLPRDRGRDAASLAVEVWSRRLLNPIGLAAGFDKNAEVPDAALRMGFGLSLAEPKHGRNLGVFWYRGVGSRR